MGKDIPVTESSGNVYADLGFKNADEMLAKSTMALRIGELIEEKRLTQKQAATLFDVSQPRISDLKRGKLSGFSMETLVRFLRALDQDVQISIKPKPRRRRHATVAVVGV